LLSVSISYQKLSSGTCLGDRFCLEDPRFKYAIQDIRYHERHGDRRAPLRVLDSDSYSDIYSCDDSEPAIRRGIAPPFFLPNIIIHPTIFAEKSPALMKYGEKIVTGRNWIDCSVRVENRPPKGYGRFFHRKGRAPAKNVQAVLWPQIVGQKNLRGYDLKWIGFSENRVLPILPNDGVSFTLHILRIRLEDHVVMVPGELDDTDRYLLPASYEISVQVGSEKCLVGTYNLPKDLIDLAKEPDNVVYATQSGGFVAYVEKTEGGTVAKFEGKINGTDILRKIAKEYKPSKMLINGRLVGTNFLSGLEE
jgi:hypothetical protein